MSNIVIARISCILIYLITIIISILFGVVLNHYNPLIIILITDIFATIIIFIISTIFNNASFYDPYWSVAPLIISIYLFFISGFIGIRQFLVLISIFIWSNRLSYNWIRQWRGFKHEDWRYADLRQKYGRFFWFINLTGIQLMPTILVYLGSLSLYPALTIDSKLNFLDIVAFVITLGAIIIETLADEQLHKFIQSRESSEQIINNGLWKISRHPNYFGEISFWIGLFMFALAVDLSFWWMIIGPLSIIILFNKVSIPLMEKRNLERKPEYRDYKERTSRLIPWFPKRS